jgi:hypothetical protein
MRVAIYARHSSDNQREASIEDQLEVCRRYAERQGWTIVKVYADRAQSGASRFRSEFQQMQMDAEAGQVDLILVEAPGPAQPQARGRGGSPRPAELPGHRPAHRLDRRGHRHACTWACSAPWRRCI